MDSNLTTQEGHYTYRTSYSRSVRTTVTTTDENGIVNTQQSTVTTNSSNPPVSAAFTTVDSDAERRRRKIAWLVCLLSLVITVVFIAVSLVLTFRVSFFLGMALITIGSTFWPIILVVIRQKLGYRHRGGFRCRGFAVGDKRSTVVPPPQSRVMSRVSIVSNRGQSHPPLPVGTTNVDQNFGASQFQTQYNTVGYPDASNSQGYQTHPLDPGYGAQQENIWAQPVGYQGYSQNPVPPPQPAHGPYADPPPSYESTIR